MHKNQWICELANYKEFKDIGISICRLFRINHHDAEDIVQAGLWKFVQGKMKPQDELSYIKFKPWYKTIIRRLCLTFVTRREFIQPNVAIEQSHTDDSDAIDSLLDVLHFHNQTLFDINVPNPEILLERHAFSSALTSCFKTLSSSIKEIYAFVLHQIFANDNEIAKVVGKSSAYVSKAISTAHTHLITCMSNKGYIQGEL